MSAAVSARAVAWGLVISLRASVSFSASSIERVRVGVPPSVNTIDVTCVSPFNASRSCSDISRGVGDGEAADDLIEGRLIGLERRRRDGRPAHRTQ